jgi:hypothetical protein
MGTARGMPVIVGPDAGRAGTPDISQPWRRPREKVDGKPLPSAQGGLERGTVATRARRFIARDSRSSALAPRHREPVGTSGVRRPRGESPNRPVCTKSGTLRQRIERHVSRVAHMSRHSLLRLPRAGCLRTRMRRLEDQERRPRRRAGVMAIAWASGACRGLQHENVLVNGAVTV